MSSKAKPARAEVDITPSWPSANDPLPPWPYTKPDPRPVPYGKPGKTVRVLILPGRMEYDPCMNAMEQRIRKLMAEAKNVVIVVPDVWRGVGEIMARRNGLNWMVINTDNAGSTVLPSVHGFDKFAGSKVARRRVLREADMVYIVDNNVAFTQITEDVEAHHEGMPVRVFKHKYKKREPVSLEKVAKKQKKAKSEALAKKKKRK